ncbi:hypothetical protein [Bdellovibrio bacteriovorus]|uniref:hypothetical protein n=1 Tax=Bdellovibrio bacteriovorus TaxID=959 RepID=UPI0012FA2BCD|nr:hypothetical protein [Bdellovibrio bacteriovorus]
MGAFLGALLASNFAQAQVSATGGGFFKNPVSCISTTISNCNLVTTPSGSSSGSCVSGYTGTCSYSCFRKTWTASANSCAPASCTLPWGGTLANGSSVTAYSSTAPVGAACSTVSQTRTCSTGTLSGSYTNSTCSSGCAAGTTSNCSYTAAAHNGASGSCVSGYTGSCSYRCNNGTRSVVSNSCAVPTGTWVNGGSSGAQCTNNVAPSGTCSPIGKTCYILYGNCGGGPCIYNFRCQ